MKKILLIFFVVFFSLSVRADFITAEQAFIHKKYQEAFNGFLLPAESGDFRAQYYLGYIYLNGLGTTKDEKKAIEFFTIAANQGHGEAILNLGLAYYNGDGVEKDNEKAIDLFKQVLKKEYPYAGRYLANAYMNSNDPDKIQKAEQAYEISARYHDYESFYRLGELYESEGDLGKAMRYYEYSATKGDCSLGYKLGMKYINGKGVEKNIIRGCAWLEIANLNGNCEQVKETVSMLKKSMSREQSQKIDEEFNRLNTRLRNIKSPVEAEVVRTRIQRKPIIYLYPEERINIQVGLGFPENVIHTYPKYNGLWQIQAEPNGNLTDLKTGRHYYALYWEGKNTVSTSIPQEGFIVAGKDTIVFLEEKLYQLGLTELEAEEFIIYWLPKLESVPYNLIRFQTVAEQNKNMPLNVTPVPQTLIRVMMEYKNLDKPIQIKEQILPEKPKRNGFTLVEWGGMEI